MKKLIMLCVMALMSLHLFAQKISTKHKVVEGEQATEDQAQAGAGAEAAAAAAASS